MKPELKAKKSLKQKPLIIIGGITSGIALAIILLLALGVLKTNDTSANNSFPFEITDAETWVVNKVEVNEIVESVNVQINALNKSFLQLKLYNEDEELLSKKSIVVEEGLNKSSFDGLSFLPPGKYLVVVSGEMKTTEKWVIKEN